MNKKCVEQVVAPIGSLVEVDAATLQKKVLAFARLRVRVPVGGETHLMKNVRFNEIECQVSIEEECVTTSCRNRHQMREMQDEASDVGSEDMFGEEFFESEGSNYGGQMEGGANGSEEASVRGPVEEALHQGSGACNVCSSGGRLSRCGEGFPKMVEQDGCMNKGGEDNISGEGVTEKKKGNVANRSAKASGRYKKVDLIVNRPIKAERRERSEFSIFMGMSPKDVEDEQAWGFNKQTLI